MPSLSQGTQPSHQIKRNSVLLTLLRFMFQLGGFFSPYLFGRISYRLWHRPIRTKLKSYEKTILNDSRHFQDSYVNGKRISTYVWGEDNKKTVLLVHGWSSRAATFYQFIPQLVDAGYRVVAFDAPGHGLSKGKETDVNEYHSIIKALHSTYGHFIGIIAHSFGALCSLYSISQGTSCDKIILISPPSSFWGLVEKYKVIFRIPDKIIYRHKKLVENRYTKLKDKVWDVMSPLNNNPEGTQSLVIHDQQDYDIPCQEGIALAKSLKNCTLILTEGLGHRKILKSDEIIKTVIQFLGKNE